MLTAFARRPVDVRPCHSRLLPAAGLLALLLAGAAQAESRPVGRYLPRSSGEPASFLVRRGADGKQWQALDAENQKVFAGDTLVSLPGFRSDVLFANGLRLKLWGDLPEMSLVTPLLESVVVVNEVGASDLDLTLDRGRIVITNTKAARPARVRLRFPDPTAKSGKESWQVNLEGGAEVALELSSRYPPGTTFNKEEPARPNMELYFFVFKGRAQVKARGRTYPMARPPAASLLHWESAKDKITGPFKAKKLPPWAVERYPALPPGLDKEAETHLRQLRAKAVRAVDELAVRMRGKEVKAGLLALLKSNSPFLRTLTVRCLGALDDLPALVNALTEPKNADVRQMAIADLRHWMAARADNQATLHDALVRRTGLTTGQADQVMKLLYSFPGKALHQPATYSRLIADLKSDTPLVRELAHWHLVRLVPAGQKIKYDPLGSAAEQRRAFGEWKKLVPEGTLPKAPKESKSSDKLKID